MPNQLPHQTSASVAPRLGDHSLLYLALPSPHLPERGQSFGRSAVVSVMLHGLAGTALILLAVGSARVASSTTTTSTNIETLQIPRIVFLELPGPGGGGGGGGNRQPAPPSRAQAIGRDHLMLPVARPIVVKAEPADAVPTLQSLSLQALPLASGAAYQIGLPEAASLSGLSQGPGSGGGVGEGSGTGAGPGTGPGLGPGTGGGFGDGVRRPGNGVTSPTLITQVRPNYTSDAMSRKIMGTVVLEVVVGRDGIPSAMRVVRSLDPYGLDVEAIRAVQQWRFNPGRIGAMPVDVLVRIVLDFRIH